MACLCQGPPRQRRGEECYLQLLLQAFEGSFALGQPVGGLFSGNASLGGSLVSTFTQDDALQPAGLLLAVTAPTKLLVDSHGQRCLVGESLQQA